MDISDAALLRRWQQRSDSEAFTLLVMRHSGMVFNTCNRILRNRADAEDVTQECFMELGAVHTLVGNSLGGLLHTLATHRSLDRLKRESRRREREIRYAMGRPSSYTIGWDDIYPHIDEAIASLPIKYRDSIIRHFLKGQTHAEIGRELGIADPTVRYRINKGIERVRADLHRRGVTASASIVGSVLEESTAELVSANLAANLGKLSVAGAGNTTFRSTPLPTRGRTLAMTKALGILLIGALLGLIVWMMRSETLPADHADHVAPAISPEIQRAAPENEAIIPPAGFEAPIEQEAIEEVAKVPPVESPVTDRNVPECDSAVRDREEHTPTPDVPREVVATVPPVESPEPQGTLTEDDTVARDEEPHTPMPDVAIEVVPPAGVPETTAIVPEKEVVAEDEAPEVPMGDEENVQVASVPPVEVPMPEEESITIAQAMVPLKFELPEAFFGGTPMDYWGPNLEEETYSDRPDFLAPHGTAVISRGKPVKASAAPTVGALEQLTDGDKDYAKTSVIELPEGLQWVQIDLGKSSAIYAVLVWHFHEGKRIYFDFVVQVSDDPEFETGETTIYSNDFDNSAGLGVGEDKEYIESNKGRLIDAQGTKGRYLRVYGKGNTASDFNHFIEVEVWGK